MAVNLSLLNSTTTTNINTNFQRVQTALQDTLGRSGSTPNQMNVDLDLNSNDIINGGNGFFDSLYVDGTNVEDLVGPKGWTPIYGSASRGSDIVLQLVGYEGGAGASPTEFIGWYIGPGGYVQDISNATAFSASGISDGDKGDVVVSGTGSVWMVPVLGSEKITYLNGLTNTVSRTAYAKLKEDGVSILDFGAVGDGITDDTVAINNAMASGVGKLLFPSGRNFIVSASITAVSNISIIGYGSKMTQITSGQEGFKDIVGVDKFELYGLELVGPAPVPIVANGTDRGIELFNASQVKIRDCKIRNWGSEGVFLSGGGVAAGARYAEISNNYFYNCRNTIFVYNDGRYLQINENFIGESAQLGIFLDDVSLSDTGTTSRPVQMSNVCNNIIKGYGRNALSAGITTGYVENVNFQGNIIEDGNGNAMSFFTGGVTLDPPKPCLNLIVHGNQIRNVTRSGIVFVGVQNSIITSNIIRGPWVGASGANAAIDLQAATANAVTESSINNIISNNMIQAIGGSDMDYGIRLRAGCNNNIGTGNKVIGATTSAISNEGTGNTVA